MSTFDYAEFQVLAAELFTEFGRSVVLNKIDTTPADSSKPWRGPTDIAASPDDTAAVDGVFLDTISSRYLGLTIERQEGDKGEQKLVLIATNAAPTKDLRLFNELVDGSTRYYIQALNVLQPGDEEIFIAFKAVQRNLMS